MHLLGGNHQEQHHTFPDWETWVAVLLMRENVRPYNKTLNVPKAR